MLLRFTAACAVASVIIAAGALASLLNPRWGNDSARILTTAWCFVPLAWGLWAMLAPARWVPGRLPMWGAILGVFAGVVAGPALDLPLRLGGLSGVRWAPIVAGPIVYFVFWLPVRATYGALRAIRQPAASAGGSTGP